MIVSPLFVSLIEAVIGVAVIGAAAHLASRAARRRSALLHRWIWLTALIGMAAIPLIVPRPFPRTVTAPNGIVWTGHEGAAEQIGTPHGRADGGIRVIAWGMDGGFGVSHAVWIFWGVGGLAVLVRLGSGIVSTHRLVRRADPIRSTRWWDQLELVRRELGRRQRPRLVASPDVVSPVVWGVRHPTIVIPTRRLECSRDEMKAVLVHEVAHIRQHDVLSRLAACCVCAIFWFHPIVWLAARNLRFEAERACDELVLASGIKRSGYVRYLLSFIESIPAVPVMMTAGVGVAKSDLWRRIEAMAGHCSAPGVLGTGPRALCLAAGSALMLGLAAVSTAFTPGKLVVINTDTIRLESRDSSMVQLFESGKAMVFVRDQSK